eukprot:CAMPEP_0118972062 /NCGR_PEP_ID=MMETSP1173-20130426/8495_1 /TAXON_ID=1034831 /ORGANISM="Rhizochromulina marina cf, Strain CCMP1243" /LENGTH=591 /DNA_ID=CAMNT_0006921569 /DNA_START=56 /DNA_END=1831 /DNA_ORIENTATION=-
MTHQSAIVCPTCRSTTALAHDGVRTLARNFTLVRMLELLEIQESKQFDCGDCDERDTGGAVNRCLECSLFLCRECTRYHGRRRDTKNHQLITISEFKAKAEELHQPTQDVLNLYCPKHKGEHLRLYCVTCEQLICRDCTMIDHVRPEHRYVFVHEAGHHHRQALESALELTARRVPRAEDLIRITDCMIDEVTARARDVEAEVRACLQQQRYQLLMREEELVASIHTLRNTKEKMLHAHKEALELFLGNVRSSCDFTRRILTEGTASEVLATKAQILRQLSTLSSKELNEKLPVDSSLYFLANTQAFAEIVETFATVTVSSSFPPLCQVIGDGVSEATVGKPASFTIITFDTQGEKRDAGGDIISVKVEHPNQEPSSATATFDEHMSLSIEDNANGTYFVQFTPTIASNHAFIHVSIQSTPISNSPFSLEVHKAEVGVAQLPVPATTDAEPPASAPIAVPSPESPKSALIEPEMSSAPPETSTQPPILAASPSQDQEGAMVEFARGNVTMLSGAEPATSASSAEPEDVKGAPPAPSPSDEQASVRDQGDREQGAGEGTMPERDRAPRRGARAGPGGLATTATVAVAAALAK